MIVGLFLRNFKTYRGIQFIPISSQHNFNGFLGDNGVGKSSILEALDCFFNNKKWNFNYAIKKQGIKHARPYIVPIFAVRKEELLKENDSIKNIINNLDQKFRNIKSSDINIGSADKSVKDIFINTHNKILNNFGNEYYVFPVGIDYEQIETISIFETSFEVNNSDLQEVLAFIKSKIDYVYIPKDIDSEQFTKLETEQIQVLMGESLDKILTDRVTESSVNNINEKLNEFISQLESELVDYSYRTPTDRQQNIRRSNINDLIIRAFFNIRKLHKKRDGHYIEINALSSGEKQKAIIDLAHSLLKNHRKDGKNLIIAIDEPEASLHISACFEQFSSLFDISTDCRQVLFSSHWYGFLPILNKTNVCVISKGIDENTHLFDLIDLTNYREQILEQIKYSKNKLPYHINLKSITDLSQSIITSVTSSHPYNWLICEGSSEKIYFDKYFENEIKENRLRVLPVGGAKKIKELYQNLLVSYESIKGYENNKENRKRWGKIILISDTDSNFIDYETNDDDNLKCLRIVNDNSETQLVKISQNPKSPETEIEDCLNGKLFVETLKSFINVFPDLEKVIETNKDYSDKNSAYSLDLRPSERNILKSFFDDNKGNNKLRFAEKYVELMISEYAVPEWILTIKEMYRMNK